MKKKILLIAALFTAGLSFAQDGLTSKKGVPILPEAGDWAIGFDASSLLNYGGNLLNGSADNSLDPMGDINATTIYGKYFVDANKAYRGMVRIGFGSNTNTGNEPDANDPNATVQNDTTVSGMNITLGGGIEMRRGKGRLQGVYGPTAMITLGTASTKYTYGNDAAGRVTEDKQGSTFGITVGGFGGVEYFFAPKISVGAEVMWGINFTSTGAGEETRETSSGSTTTETGSSSAFTIDLMPNSVISLNFHF